MLTENRPFSIRAFLSPPPDRLIGRPGSCDAAVRFLRVRRRLRSDATDGNADRREHGRARPVCPHNGTDRTSRSDVRFVRRPRSIVIAGRSRLLFPLSHAFCPLLVSAHRRSRIKKRTTIAGLVAVSRGVSKKKKITRP